MQSPLAALAARTGKGPKGDVAITMVGDGKRPRPKNDEVVWNATYTKWRHKDGTTRYDK